MKKRPEDDLLNDVFAGADDLRSRSLERTLSSVRCRRRTRKAIQIAGVAMIAIGLFYVVTLRAPFDDPESRETVARAFEEKGIAPTPLPVPTVPGTEIRVVSDEELFAMFPNQAVAVVGNPDEEQQLVFLK